jgi:dTDP-4-amino-4,6-dideoxygalactose transaminase
MRKEIGGEWHLPLSHLLWKNLGQHSAFIPNGFPHFLMSNGRASIRLILREILKVGEGDEVLLPAYLFQGLQNPFKESGMKIKFYKLNGDLTLDTSDIERKMSGNTKVLFIMHYFGFPQPVSQLKELRESYPSCSIIEDITQSFLTSRLDSSLGRFGDFNFTVYMKYIPTPDGSLLQINRSNGDIEWRNWQFKRLEYTTSRYTAMILKSLYLKGYPVPKTWFLKLFRYGARMMEEYPMFALMSRASIRLLDKMDYEKSITRRRENYQHLLNNWESSSIVPMHSDLPGSVCPYGFVVLTENRDYLREELTKSKIYCPVHWQPIKRGDGEVFSRDINPEEFPTSWDIARKIMMIPIDQRYGIDEMNYILEQLKRISNHTGSR